MAASDRGKRPRLLGLFRARCTRGRASHKGRLHWRAIWLADDGLKVIDRCFGTNGAKAAARLTAIQVEWYQKLIEENYEPQAAAEAMCEWLRRMAIGRRTCTACLAAAQRERRRAESEELAEAAADRDMRCEIRARFLLAGIQLGRY